MAVAAEIEDDGLRLAGLAAADRLVDHRADRVGGFGRGDCPFGAGEGHGGLEHRVLPHRHGLRLSNLHQVADERRHAVVTQPARMDARRHEAVAQGKHLDQRRRLRRVAEIVLEPAPRDRRARRRLDRYEPRPPARQAVGEEGEREAREVAPAADAGDEAVGPLADLLELLLRLEPDDSLVQQDVVEDAAQRVVGVFVRGGDLDGLADRHAEASRAVGVLGQDHAAGMGRVARAGQDVGAPGLHHELAVGLLLVAHANHVDEAFEAEDVAREGQGAAPLPGAGLGGEASHAFLLIVERLGDGGVGLVAACRADALVLEIDLRRGLERLLEAASSAKRRRPPEPVDIQHLARNVDPLLRADFLLDQPHGEDRRQVVGADRLVGGGVQRRRGRHREVGKDVVPGCRQLLLAQQNLHVVGQGSRLLPQCVRRRAPQPEPSQSAAILPIASPKVKNGFERGCITHLQAVTGGVKRPSPLAGRGNKAHGDGFAEPWDQERRATSFCPFPSPPYGGLGKE